MEEKDALNYLLDHGMSFEEIPPNIPLDFTRDALRNAVASRVVGGHPIEGAGPAGEGEPRPDFTLADFKTGRVFEWLTGQNGYRQALEEPELAKLAKDLGFMAFAKCLREYRKLLKQTSLKVLREDGVSDFAEQNIELNVGEWTADETGIWRYGNGGNIIYACTHPVMPVQRLVSVDTGITKVRLAYRRSFRDKRPWSEIVVPMSRIAKAADIVSLADCGISVTSGERAQALVDFLRDCIDRNQNAIPEVKAVSRMGWNEEGFAPYVGGAAFDSADSFRPVYRAISEHGDFSQWMEEAKDARTYSLTARIVLAASFASVLVEPLGCLPFFVHLWSMDSGTGKTVAQMLGASVWANPTAGGSYFQTFKSTSVGVELMAGFLHSLPLFLDELQLAKDRHGRVNFNVYELAAGSGKLRGNRGLGLDYTPKWANCFVTSGESPIVSETDGAGAMNRVIEIECKAGNAVIRDGHRTANALKRNYGHAGKRFIEKLTEHGEIDHAKELYEKYYTDCIQSDTTEKQAMAAAIILTADALATEWIFQDGRALTAEELGEFLKEKAAVSASERGYEYMCGWVSANAAQFSESIDRGERYGTIDGNTAVINRVVWNRTCEQAGISSKALLSHLKSKGLLVLGTKGYTKTKKLDGIPTACVWLRLPVEDDLDGIEDELPL